jgi:hypothetical protein
MLELIFCGSNCTRRLVKRNALPQDGARGQVLV